MKIYVGLLVLMIAISAEAQKVDIPSTVTSSQACSPNVLSNSGPVQITCTVESGDKEATKRISRLLNSVLKQVGNSASDAELQLSKLELLLRERIPDLRGVLFPGNEPFTAGNCGYIPPDASVVRLGSSTTWTNRFPHETIRAGDEKLVSLDWVGDVLFVSGQMKSRDGKIVAEINNNQFTVNPNNYFKVEQPNTHSLLVVDQDGVRLSIDYQNPRTVKVVGDLVTKVGTISIGEEVIRLPGGGKIERFCSGGNGGADIAIF